MPEKKRRFGIYRPVRFLFHEPRDAEFPDFGFFDLPSGLFRQQLVSVAESENRDVKIQYIGVKDRNVFLHKRTKVRRKRQCPLRRQRRRALPRLRDFGIKTH
jgi:hypothetical protein